MAIPLQQTEEQRKAAIAAAGGQAPQPNPAPKPNPTGGAPVDTSSMDAMLQGFANRDPEEADKLMDMLGYSRKPANAPNLGGASKPYTVQEGDTLSKIAMKFGVPIQLISGYRSGDPNKIFPGETISIGNVQPDKTVPTDGGGGAGGGTEVDSELSKMYMDALMESMGGGGLGGAADVPDNLAQYGFSGDGLSSGFNSSPEKTVTDLVAEVMRSTQLPDAKSAINDLAKEIEDLANERDDAFQKIDDNPFLSASTKEQRKGQLEDKYELKIKNRQTRLQLIQDTYDSAKQESQFAATTAINLYDKNRNFDQSRLEFAVNQAEKRLEAMRDMTKLNPAEFKEIRGGLFNVRTGEWVVSPTEGGDGGGAGGGGLTSVLGADNEVKGARLDLMASNLRSIVAKTGPAAKIFDSAYRNAAGQGPEAAEAFLRAQYVNNVLSGAERDSFNNVNNGIANYEAAIDFLEANPDLQTGFYKSGVEGLKPKFLAGKDPRYATLINLINNAETPIRKATYGTALTPQEFLVSTRSLLNTDDDRSIILQKMRENIQIFKNGLGRNMANATGVPFEEVSPTDQGAPADDNALRNEAERAGIKIVDSPSGGSNVPKQRISETILSPLKKFLFGN